MTDELRCPECGTRRDDGRRRCVCGSYAAPVLDEDDGLVVHGPKRPGITLLDDEAPF